MFQINSLISEAATPLKSLNEIDIIHMKNITIHTIGGKLRIPPKTAFFVCLVIFFT